MEVIQHAFHRADGSTLTITSTVGDGLSVVEVSETEPVRAVDLEPAEDA